MKGRLINLAYDGQGNRKTLHVDGQLSHSYTPGPANEYTAVNYSNAVGMIAGMAEHPGRVVVGNELAERQGQYFYRDYSAGSAASWTMQKVFAAAEPPAGNYVQQYTTAQKEMYLPPASHTPSYDAAGNLLSDGWWTYEYDGENRLIRQASVAYHPDGRSRELLFNYDYLGRRVKKTVKAYSYDEETLSTTAFVYWDWHLIAELNVSWTGTVSRKRHYVWGLDKEGVRPGAGGVGGLLMVVDNVTNKTYLAMNDYIGNVIGLVDPDNGSTVAEYEYDPFGRPIRETGSYAAQNPIRFSSQYTDQETGLVYFGFRYYHPQWGRFINRDPIEEAGGENLYRFVSNDPVNRWDLVGLSEQPKTIDEIRRADEVMGGGLKRLSLR